MEPVNPDSEVTVVESLCMQCHSQGVTRILLCSIPFFRGNSQTEIVLMSFSCEACGFHNNDVQSAGSLAPYGVRIELRVTSTQVLNRELVKSEFASLTIPEIGLEVPPSASKAVFTTIEGVLSRVAEDLELNQPQRLETDPVTAAAVGEIILKLKRMVAGEFFPFSIRLEDPSGNSHIVHDFANHPNASDDPNFRVEKYERTREQLVAMGYASDDVPTEELKEAPTEQLEKMSLDENAHVTAQNVDFSQPVGDKNEAPVEFHVECYACHRLGKSSMCLTNIPHFKETLVMGFRCDYCGASSTEVKGGGGVPPQGTLITLTVRGPQDLQRDIIKSDTAVVRIPAIGLELSSGTLGGMVTTVEGLLVKIQEELLQHASESLGDSLSSTEANNYRSFMRRLQDFHTTVSEQYTLELDDPLSNSFISSPTDDDPYITRVLYDRTEEQNDDLGLTDMRV